MTQANSLQEKIVSIDELYGVFKENLNTECIVDVRSSTEAKTSSIEGALAIPIEQVLTESHAIAESLKKYKTAYLLCNDGQTALKGYQALQKAGATNLLYAGIGGLQEWLKKSYPHIRSGEKKVLDDVPEWILDFQRMDKKAWCHEVSAENEGRFRENLDGLQVLNIENTFIIFHPQAKTSVILFPQESSAEHVFDQTVRRGLTPEAIVGSGPCAREVSKAFQAPLIEPALKFSTEILGKQLTTSETAVSFLGMEWSPQGIEIQGHV